MDSFQKSRCGFLKLKQRTERHFLLPGTIHYIRPGAASVRAQAKVAFDFTYEGKISFS